MNRNTTITSGVVAAAVAALLAASPALAQVSAGAASCRAAIAKNYGKLLSTGHKTIAGCHKSRNAGKIGNSTDCNDMSQADSKGKFGKARTKSESAIPSACGAVAGELLTDSGSTGKRWYHTCPVPCGALPDPMTTMTQVAQCLSCMAEEAAETAGTATLGLPVVASLTKTDAKCHGAIAKGFGKYAATRHKTETACQGAIDKAGDAGLHVDGCLGDDPKGKTLKARDKALAGIDKSCLLANLAALDSCSDTLSGLRSCGATQWSRVARTSYLSTYELGPTYSGCPKAIRTTIRGGCSTLEEAAGICGSGGQTGTSLSVGWTGLAHDIDVTDAYTLAGDVTCPGSSAGSCGVCTVDGVSYDNLQYQDFARCQTAPWIPCTNLFAADPACGGGQCIYYLGPPLAVSAGGTPTCTLNRMSTDISGTADPDAGETDLLINLRALVHSGNNNTRPCPICRNDLVAQDGIRDGTCLGGTRDGQACDIQGIDLTFAPTDAENPTAGNSLDCPPGIGANISGAGLAIALPLTTGPSTKDAVDTCEAPYAAFDCFCGVCSHDSTVACNDDAECDALSMGSNCGASAGVARRPNNCTDNGCDVVMGQTDRGQCDGNFNTFCDGAVTAKGVGILSCNTDADCEALEQPSMNPDDWVCPGNSCGTCALNKIRSCFLDPIVTTGTPDTDNPILAGTFCLPPTSNPSVNGASGSPGPGVVKTDTLVERRY